MGRNRALFPVYKFRTLRSINVSAPSVAPEDDPRITGIGLWMRRWRLDELPQLISVLRGHMSLVGPRPMPSSHAETLPKGELDILLSVRPGITDEAAVHFLAEDAVLAGCEDAERLYLERILPAKALMQIDSLRHSSIFDDLCTVTCTLTRLWSPRARQESVIAMRELLERNSH